MEPCQCQATTHGHEPGQCENEATEEDRICKDCKEIALKMTPATQMPTPPRGPSEAVKSTTRDPQATTPAPLKDK
jgi:hypothetical protein